MAVPKVARGIGDTISVMGSNLSLGRGGRRAAVVRFDRGSHVKKQVVMCKWGLQILNFACRTAGIIASYV